MGLRLNHISASNYVTAGQSVRPFHALAISGAAYFQPGDRAGHGVRDDAVDSVRGFSAHPDAAYIFSGTIGGTDKSVFLGDVVISGSLGLGGESGLINGAGSPDKIAIFSDDNTLTTDGLAYDASNDDLYIGDSANDPSKVLLGSGSLELHHLGKEGGTASGLIMAGAGKLAVSASHANGGIEIAGKMQVGLSSGEAGSSGGGIGFNVAGRSHVAIGSGSYTIGPFAASGHTLSYQANATSYDVNATNGLTLDSAGAGANLTVTSAADGQDLLVSQAGGTNSSVHISSSGTSGDALTLTTTAGGIDITNGGAAGGSEDLDIVSSAASVNISGGEAERDAVRVVSTTAGSGVLVAVPDADGIIQLSNVTGDTNIKITSNSVAASEKVSIKNGAGDALDSIKIVSDNGGIDIDSAKNIVVANSSTTAGDGVIVDLAGTTTTNFLVRDGSADVAFKVTAAKDAEVGRDLTVTRNATITGDLIVQGATTTVSSSNMVIQDSIIGLGFSGSDDAGALFNNVGERAIIFGKSANQHDFLPALNWTGTTFELGKYDASPSSGSMQAAKSYADLKVGGLTLAGGLSLPDSAGDHVLRLKADEDNLSGNKTLLFRLNDQDHDLVMSGTLSVEAVSRINQDLTSDSTTAVLSILTLSSSLRADTNGGADIGTTGVGFGDIFVADDKKLQLGDSQDFTIEFDADGDSVAQLAGSNVRIGHGAATELQFRDSALRVYSSVDGQLDLAADTLAKVTSPTVELEATSKVIVDGPEVALEDDGAKISFGNGAPTSLTHIASNDALRLNSSNKLEFGDDGTFIHQVADGSLLIESDGGDVDNIAINAGNANGGIRLRVNAADFIVADGSSPLAGNAAAVVLHKTTIPASDNSVDLGSNTQRFANIYTGDLNLRNDRGDWTLIEEEDFISFRNNKTGRRFRMVMEDITGLGIYGPGNDGEM